MEEAERPQERGWEGHSRPCLSVGTIDLVKHGGSRVGGE